MTIIVVSAVGGVFLLWAGWWVYRGTPKHGKHYTTVPPADLAKALHEVRAAGQHGTDSLMVLKAAAQGAKQENADLGHVTATLPAPRHATRDPLTGRFVRREQ